MLQRISQLDWPRLLYTRKAAILLGMASVLSIATIVIIQSNIDANKLSPPANIAFSIVATVSPAGFLALLAYMAFFWLKCDTSSKALKTVWFFALLFGFFFGSAVAYYAFVYLPAVRKKLRHAELEIEDIAAPEPARERGRIGPFRRTLLIAWGVGLVPVVVVLLLPKPVPDWLLMPVAIASFLLCVVAAVEAVFHVFVSFYRTGISRSAGSSRPHWPHAKNRD